MLIQLVALASALEDPAHVPWEIAVEGEVVDEMEDTPLCDEVGAVRVVLDVAESLSGIGALARVFGGHRHCGLGLMGRARCRRLVVVDLGGDLGR